MPSPPSLSHPHLQGLQADLEAIDARVAALKARSPEQLSWNPQPGSWNVLECLDHLITTDALYIPRIREAIEKASPEGKADPYRPSFVGRKFIAFISPDATRKTKTVSAFEPHPALSDVTVLDRFLAHQAEIRDLLRRADGVNLNRVKLSSPVTRLLRLRIGEALTMLVRHQQRHLQQAQRVLERPGFPAAPAPQPS